VFRPTGRTFWWNRDDALGRDRLGVSCIRTRSNQRIRRVGNPRSTPHSTAVGMPIASKNGSQSLETRTRFAFGVDSMFPRVLLRLS
jgi:hypothetical protein